MSAERAVVDAEQRVQAVADSTYAKFAADVAALREEVRKLQKYLDDLIHNAVDNHVVQTLRDYARC